MEEEDHHHQKELQLLPILPPPPPPPQPPPPPTWLLPPPEPSTSDHHTHPFKRPQPPPANHHDHQATTTLDLQLSISCVEPPTPRAATSSKNSTAMKKIIRDPQVQQAQGAYAEALRWQAAEQIRLAAMERAYAERVRELTRREMEMAHSEFARARAVWERAREEVAKAERLKESAIVFGPSKLVLDPSSSNYNNYNDEYPASSTSGNCIEIITCHSCRQRFRP